MRAVRYHTYGDPSVLQVDDLPTPAPGPDEVLVRVAAAGVGGGEPAIRAGKLRKVLRQKLPAGSGVDFSGTISAVGTNIDAWAVGDRVWGIVPHGTFGAIAEDVVLPQTRVSAAPQTIELADAGALPASGTTALRALAGVRPGQRVLVRGAAGGVGNVVVQLAASLGAEVTTLASARDSDWLLQLGATTTLDYRATPIGTIGSYHRIVDLVGTDLRVLRRRLELHGSLIALAFDPQRPVRTLLNIAAGSVGRRRIRAFSNDPTSADLDTLRERIDRGSLRPVVQSRYPFDEAPAAHRDLERGGVRGKILLIP